MVLTTINPHTGPHLKTTYTKINQKWSEDFKIPNHKTTRKKKITITE